MRTTWQVPQLTSDRVLQQLLRPKGGATDRQSRHAGGPKARTVPRKGLEGEEESLRVERRQGIREAA